MPDLKLGGTRRREGAVASSDASRIARLLGESPPPNRREDRVKTELIEEDGIVQGTRTTPGGKVISLFTEPSACFS